MYISKTDKKIELMQGRGAAAREGEDTDERDDCEPPVDHLEADAELAVKWELLEKNPASGQEKFKEPPHRERYLSKEELSRFLRALEGDEDRLSVAAIRLLLFTGCRRGEVMSLKWEQVKMDEERLFLPARTPRHLNDPALRAPFRRWAEEGDRWRCNHAGQSSITLFPLPLRRGQGGYTGRGRSARQPLRAGEPGEPGRGGGYLATTRAIR